MKHAWSLLLAGWLVCGSALLARAEDAVDWKPFIDFDGQLFPSYIIATATLKIPEDDADGDEQQEDVIGDPQGLIGIQITSPKDGTKIKVTVKGDSILETSVFEGELPESGGDYLVFPKINYKYDFLHRVRQQVPLNIAIDVEIDGAPTPEQIETVTLRSINDCPLSSVDPETEESFDMSWMFAAYVNENHPQIDAILREALDTGIVNAFDGYQANDEEDVYTQVFAIWNVMQRRGFKYSNAVTTPGASDKVFSQNVRFVDQSLKTAQANCVDGSVLFASILRKIGLNVNLVLVPGHCFLSFDLDAEGNSTSGLETTMMGQDNLKKYDEIKGMSKARAEKLKEDASWETFSAAIDVGTQALDDNADKFDADDQTDYLNIAIEPAREMGIMPIAYVE